MMKRVLVLMLIGFICVAEETKVVDHTDEYIEYTESVNEDYHTKTLEAQGVDVIDELAECDELVGEGCLTRALETRCGDFTELVGKDWQSRTFTVVNRIDKGKAIVIIIKDSAGPLYCVKQIRLDTQSKRGYQGYLMGHVRDVVSSYVFESMGIRYDEVRIIPASVNFMGKHYPDRLATLHEFAHGSNKTHDFPFPYTLHNI